MDHKKLIFPLLFSVIFLASCVRSSTPEIHPEAPPAAWQTAEVFLSYATEQNRTKGSASALTAEILEKSNGRIYCNPYTAGQLGGDAELMRAVSSGAISAVQLGTSVQVAQVPELALLDTPYLFPDVESCNKQLSGALLDFFQPYYNREGLQLLAWYCPGFRELSSNSAVKTSNDLRRLKIRILDNKYHRIFWSAVGAEPYHVEFSNLFYAIQQGVVNAQENTPAAAISIHLQQLQKYMIMIDHLPFINAVVMNKAYFDSLSSEDQETVVKVFRDYCNSMQSASVEQELTSYFSYVLIPSEELKQALQDGALAVREALQTDLGTETTDRFYAIVNSEMPNPP